MDRLSYEQACRALDRALVFGINPSLDGITQLCDELDRPQDAYRVVQVAGTNGKTSTARITHALLSGQGCRAGLYTSPALERANDRIELDGGPVSDQDFAEAVSAAVGAAERLRPYARGTSDGFTEFELATAAALWLFRERGVEVAVLEVGLGGRWDATSVARPAVAVITGVGLDHIQVLGDTLEQIAAEKAAIIVPGSHAVLGPGTDVAVDVFLEQVLRAGAQVTAVREAQAPSPVSDDSSVRFRVTSRPGTPIGRTMLDVTGGRADYAGLSLATPAYQAANAATAIAAAEALLGNALDTEAVAAALAALRLPGRFEVLREEPPLVIDGSHNPQAAEVLARAIDDAWPDATVRPCIVLGVLGDKDAEGIVKALAEVASALVLVTPDSPRALPAKELASVAEHVVDVPVTVADSLEEALRDRAERCEDGLVVTGSLVMAGQARRMLRDASATG